MTTLASVERMTRTGMSVWDFCTDSDSQFLARSNRGREVTCSDVDDLRRFYRRMIGYGFTPVLVSGD